MSLGSLGGISIDLAANTATFETDFARARKIAEKQSEAIQKALEQAGEKITDQFKDMGKEIIAGLGAIELGKQFFESINGAIESMDSLNKASQKVGVTTERLSELKYAASLADVGFEDLVKGLQKFNVAGVAARNGGNEQAAAFKAVGLSLADLAKLSPDEQLNKVADAFENAHDSADKTAIAIALFGKAGADLIPLLNEGSKGIKEAADEAALFHQIVGAQAAKSAEEFNDNLTRLGTASKGVGALVASDLLPAMLDVSGALVDYAKQADVGASISQGLLNIFQTIAVLGVNLAYVFDQIGDGIGGMAAQAVALAHLDFAGVGAINDAMVEEGKTARENVDKLTDKIMGLKVAARDAGDAAIDMNAIFDAQKKGDLHYDPAALAVEEAARKKAAADAEAAAKKAIADAGRQAEAEAKLIDQHEQAYLAIGDETEVMKFQAAVAVGAYDQITDAGLERLLQLAQLTDAAKAALAAEKDFAEVSEEAAKAREQAAGAALKGSKTYGGVDDAVNTLTGIENAKYGKQSDKLQGDKGTPGADQDKANKAIEEAAAMHQQRLAEITENGEKAKSDITNKYLDAGKQALADAADAAALFGKKGFEAYKAAAIAETVISTFESAQKAASSLYDIPVVGPVLAVAAAAAAVGAGLARVSAIRSQTYTARRYGGPVNAGGMYEVAEPGNPELLRYGNKTMLMMGAQSGVVEPATRAAPSGSGGMQIINNAPGISIRRVNNVMTIDMADDLVDVAVGRSQVIAAKDARNNGPVTQAGNSRTGIRRKPVVAGSR
jgi:hypothetical protein